MRILLYECRKVIQSPIFLGLFLLFSVYNIYLIVSSSDHKEELKIVNELIDTYGRDISDTSLAQLDQDIQKEMTQLKRSAGLEFQSVHELLENMSLEEQEAYSQEQWNQIQQLAVKEMYFNTARSIDESYAEIDIQATGEGEVRMYGLSGSAAFYLLQEYEKLDKRFEELVKNGEQKQWFFAGKAYFMHSFLFQTVFRHIIIESLLLIVLATALITAYEFEQKTQLLIFSTKRGRKLMKDKFSASIAIALFTMIFLLGITLGTFFIVFDYSHVWSTSISSAFNWEYNFPYIAWWDISVGTFLWLAAGIVLAGGLLISCLTFALATVVKNSYIAFAGISLFFVAVLLLPSFMSKSSILFFITGYNLSQLLLGISNSFMGGGLTGSRNYEWLTVSCWTLIAAGICFVAYRRFTKTDIG